jgi:hypothetical protein
MLGNVGDELSPAECRAFGVPQGNKWEKTAKAGGGFATYSRSQ